MGKEIVVDTSVALKWFASEGEDNLVMANVILDKVANREVVLVEPELIYYELINVLKMSKGLSRDQVKNVCDYLNSFKVTVVTFDRVLREKIIDLAISFPITSYDAAFIAVAELKKIPLVTADDRHHKKSFSKYIVPLKDYLVKNPLLDLAGIEVSKTGEVGKNVDDIYKED